MKSLTLIEICSVLDLAYGTELITAEQEMDLISMMRETFEAKYCPTEIDKDAARRVYEQMRNDARESSLNDEITSALRNALYDNN